MNARQLAAAEEQWDTVPPAQFVAERTLRAAMSSAERDRYRLEGEVSRLQDALAEALALIDAQTAVMAELGRPA